MENHFSKKMASKSDSELSRIVAQKDSFDDQAVLAAIWELEKRDSSDETTELAKDELATRSTSKKELDQSAPYISKTIVFLASLLIFPLLGAILFCINLYDAKQIKGIATVLTSVILYSLVSAIAFSYTNYHFGTVIIANALGAAIVSELFWKKYLNQGTTQANSE